MGGATTITITSPEFPCFSQQEQVLSSLELLSILTNATQVAKANADKCQKLQNEFCLLYQSTQDLKNENEELGNDIQDTLEENEELKRKLKEMELSHKRKSEEIEWLQAEKERLEETIHAGWKESSRRIDVWNDSGPLKRDEASINALKSQIKELLLSNQKLQKENDATHNGMFVMRKEVEENKSCRAGVKQDVFHSKEACNDGGLPGEKSSEDVETLPETKKRATPTHRLSKSLSNSSVALAAEACNKLRAERDCLIDEVAKLTAGRDQAEKRAKKMSQVATQLQKNVDALSSENQELESQLSDLSHIDAEYGTTRADGRTDNDRERCQSSLQKRSSLREKFVRRGSTGEVTGSFGRVRPQATKQSSRRRRGSVGQVIRSNSSHQTQQRNFLGFVV